MPAIPNMQAGAKSRHFDRRRLARFGVVGALGTAIYYAALWLLVEVIRVPVLIATSIAFILVCVSNYLLHYVWTFASDKAHTTAFPRFLFMSLVGFWINWGIMFGGVEKLAMHYLVTQAFAIAVVVAWNFLLSSSWIFRDSPGHG